MVVSVDAATPDEVLPVVVADAVVASLYPMVDVVKVPCRVDCPEKYELLSTQAVYHSTHDKAWL